MESKKHKESYRLPSLDLLDPLPSAAEKPSKEDMLAQSEILARKLMDYDIQGYVTQVYLGPVLTRFEYLPAPKTRVQKIIDLSGELARAMKAENIFIVTPLPGTTAVGIDVQNNTREMVYFRQIIESPEYICHKLKLKVPLGKDVFGQSVVSRIDKMPNLLVAGAIGSGKSVMINSIIMGLLYNAQPDELKLVLIDPKIPGLTIYNEIPHLLTPVVTRPKRAAETLRAIWVEMDRRYQLFDVKGVRNIDSYNKSAPERERLPYIVVIINELADLMRIVQSSLEDSIMRLANLGQKAGIHVIMSSRQSNLDIFTSLSKANLATRISFQVSSKADSCAFLGVNGAEKLLGRGDMLFLLPGRVHTIRMHGCFVSDEEIKRVVEFHQKQFQIFAS